MVRIIIICFLGLTLLIPTVNAEEKSAEGTFQSCIEVSGTYALPQ